MVQELSGCSNDACNLRMACERANLPKEEGRKLVVFNSGEVEGDQCSHFIVRRALGGGNSDIVFERGRRGKRHNAHAPPRTQFTGSEELFGKIFTPTNGQRRHRGAYGSADLDGRSSDSDEVGSKGSSKKLPQFPDLMTKRHLRQGKDIKNKDDE